MILTDGVHLAAADLDKLHEFAASIGLPRRWFHPHKRHPHYDLLTAEARGKALAAGAKLVRPREIVILLKENFEGETGKKWSQSFESEISKNTDKDPSLIYAVTVAVDEEIRDEWSNWMRSVHIPDVLATGLFRSAKMLRVSEPTVEGRSSYRFEYALPDRTAFDDYQKNHAPRLQADHTERYAGRFEASRSIAEIQTCWETE